MKRSAVRHAVLSALVVALAVPLGGCGQQAPAPVRVSASTTQFRPQEGSDILRTGVTNEGRAPITVSTASLVWPGFSTRPVKVAQSVVPGDTAAFDMAYGAPRCAVPPPRAARLSVTVDGKAMVVPLKVEDAGLLVRLWQRACATERLDAVATVRLAPGHLTPQGYRTVIVVTRPLHAPSLPVRVVDVGGSVILDLVATGLPETVHGARLRVPLLIHPTLRCDPHSLSQSQQTFLLSAFVRRAGDPVVRVFLRLSPAIRSALQKMIDRDCV